MLTLGAGDDCISVYIECTGVYCSQRKRTATHVLRCTNPKYFHLAPEMQLQKL